MREWNLGKPKLSNEGSLEYRERKQLDLDPRHPDNREQNQTHTMEDLKMLKKIFPKTGNTLFINTNTYPYLLQWLSKQFVKSN